MTAASKWEGFNLLAFDLETTGIDVYQDRIVQAALVDVAPGRRPATTSWLVNPGIPIPDGAAEVHGITTDRAVAEGGDPAQMLYELTGRLALWLGRGQPVVGMNLSYDLTLLEAENRRHGIDTLLDRLGVGKIQPIIDVGVLDKKADPYRRGGRRLENLCTHYQVRHTGTHDAGADALAAARLFPRIMARHAGKSFRGHTIGSLHQSQVGWRQEQMDGLRSYFDRKGQEHDGCCGEWPVHARCAPAGVAR